MASTGDGLAVLNIVSVWSCSLLLFLLKRDYIYFMRDAPVYNMQSAFVSGTKREQLRCRTGYYWRLTYISITSHTGQLHLVSHVIFFNAISLLTDDV